MSIKELYQALQATSPKRRADVPFNTEILDNIYYVSPMIVGSRNGEGRTEIFIGGEVSVNGGKTKNEISLLVQQKKLTKPALAILLINKQTDLTSVVQSVTGKKIDLAYMPLCKKVKNTRLEYVSDDFIITDAKIKVKLESIDKQNRITDNFEKGSKVFTTVEVKEKKKILIVISFEDGKILFVFPETEFTTILLAVMQEFNDQLFKTFIPDDVKVKVDKFEIDVESETVDAELCTTQEQFSLGGNMIRGIKSASFAMNHKKEMKWELKGTAEKIIKEKQIFKIELTKIVDLFGLEGKSKFVPTFSL